MFFYFNVLFVYTAFDEHQPTKMFRTEDRGCPVRCHLVLPLKALERVVGKSSFRDFKEC